MKKRIAKVVEFILIIIGVPFLIADKIHKNKASRYMLNKLNYGIGCVNWWRVK